MAFVRFESGPRKGETLDLYENKIMFGRHLSCHCLLNHPTVSREHFFIELTGDKYFVVDNESGNGTFVNEERVSWVELKDGDQIKAGPFVLRFHLANRDASLADSDEPFEVPSALLAEHSAAEEQQLSYPIEYLEGIKHFNKGRYFEAHEVWEEIWLHSTGDTKLFYQTLIQAAVGLHHFMRGNLRGARGMYKNVLEKLDRLPPYFMALDLLDFTRQFTIFFADLIDDRASNQYGIDKVRPRIHLAENESAGESPTDEL
jgi:hypothetical protein